jgi:ribose transport system permease protein
VRISGRRLGFGFDRFSGLYLWALFILIFGIWEPHLFLTLGTVHSIASEQAVAALLGLAVVVPLATGAFDLSIGATANLSAVVVAILQSQQHWSMWPAIVVALLIGVLIGAVNGFIIVRLQVNAFIATLGMATIVGAVETIVSGNSQPQPPTSSAWADITQYQIFGFQAIFFYVIIIALISWWFLERTPAGRYMYATGGNGVAARLSGVRVGGWTWLSLIFSGTVAGLAGVLFSSQSGPSLTFGAALLLPAYAAAFLGSTQLRPGRFNVWGTVLAVFVLATGVYGVQLITSVQWLNDMFNGVALIVAVSFAVWRQRRARADPTPAHPAGSSAAGADPGPADGGPPGSANGQSPGLRGSPAGDNAAPGRAP